eukprot:SAG11_NODE_32008_length_287_cov_0.813830_1_plen_75_part_10
MSPKYTVLGAYPARTLHLSLKYLPLPLLGCAWAAAAIEPVVIATPEEDRPVVHAVLGTVHQQPTIEGFQTLTPAD